MTFEGARWAAVVVITLITAALVGRVTSEVQETERMRIRCAQLDGGAP